MFRCCFRKNIANETILFRCADKLRLTEIGLLAEIFIAEGSEETFQVIEVQLYTGCPNIEGTIEKMILL